MTYNFNSDFRIEFDLEDNSWTFGDQESLKPWVDSVLFGENESTGDSLNPFNAEMLEMNEEKCFDGQNITKDNYDAGFYSLQRNLNPEKREENLDNCNLEDVYVLEDVYQNLQNLRNSENSENLINKKKKGKSAPLSKEVEDIYFKLKLHYENKNEKMPCIFRRDGVRKKIKTHFFDWIKLLVDKTLQKLSLNKKLKFEKLKQSTISNINLKFNSELFKKTVFQLYSEDSARNKYLLHALELTLNQQLLCAPLLASTSLNDLYKQYLASKQFKKDYQKIEKKTLELKDEAREEEKHIIPLYLVIYRNFSENFVEYYATTQPNNERYNTNTTESTDETGWSFRWVL